MGSVFSYNSGNTKPRVSLPKTELFLKNNSKTDYFELVNAHGKNIYAGKDIDKQDFSSLPNGIYFLKINSEQGMTLKLIKE